MKCIKSNNISIYHDTDDDIRMYGIMHFLQKLEVLSPQLRKRVTIIYGNLTGEFNEPKIQIFENDIEEYITGYLKIKNEGEKIPVFENPIKLNDNGETFVIYSNKNQVYPCITLKGNSVTIGFDVFNEVGRILTGHLEQFWMSNPNSAEFAKIPVVDYYEEILLQCLQMVNKITTQKPGPAWPEGKKFAVCLTHDVDRIRKSYQYFTHILKYLKKRNLSGVVDQITSIMRRLQGVEPYWNFEKIMRIEADFGAKSSFFFLNEKCKPKLFDLESFILFSGRYRIDGKVSQIIKKIKRSGWEIGVHGSFHSYKDKIILQKEKEELENLVETHIHGVRQHYLNLKIPLTWKLQEQVGFKYDTSLGFKDKIGFRFGTCFPFYPFDPESNTQLSLLEIPLVIMDIALLHKRDAWRECKEVIKVIEKVGGVLTLNWHQEIFELTNMKQIYKKLIKICKERGAWITSAGEIERWWNSKIKDKYGSNVAKPKNII